MTFPVSKYAWGRWEAFSGCAWTPGYRSRGSLLDFVRLQVSFTRAQWSEWGDSDPLRCPGKLGVCICVLGSTGKPSALLFGSRRFWLSELAADARLLLFVKIRKKRKPRENKLFPSRGFGRGERKSHSVELCVSQVEPWEPADVGAARKPSHNLRSLDPGARRPSSFFLPLPLLPCCLDISQTGPATCYPL